MEQATLEDVVAQGFAGTGAPTRSWLDLNAVHRRHYVVKMTAELARRWLDANTGNRPIRAVHVDRLAAVMSGGRWRPTHQGIAFDTTGRLIDGQHRLLAAVKALQRTPDAEVRMTVFVEQASDSFGVLDHGKARTFGDDIADQPRRVVEVCTFLARVLRAWDYPTTEEVQDRVNTFGASVRALMDAAGSYKVVRTTVPVTAMVSLRHHMADDEGKAYIVRQWPAWVNMDAGSMSTSVAALLRRLDGTTFRKGRPAELAAVTWIAFDPQRRDQGKIIVRDASATMRLMRSAARKSVSGVVDDEEPAQGEMV